MTRYSDGSVWDDDGYYDDDDAATAQRPLTWALEVDWDADGVWDGEVVEGIYALETDGMGRKNFINAEGNGFEPVEVGSVTVQVRNLDKKYDPYNPDSPLYGLLLPGRKFRLRVMDEVAQILQPVMTGYLDDIRPIYDDINAVKISGSNGMRRLDALNISTPVWTGLRFSEAITKILEAAGWVDPTDIDSVISETMPFWWAKGAKASYEIQSIVDAALGLFCVSEDGTALYKSRVGTGSPVVSLTGEDIQADYGIRSAQPWEVVRNRIRVYARARKAVTATELWRLVDVPFIAAGATVVIWANFSYASQEVTVTSIIDPVITTDYKGTANVDGTGTDYSANLVITHPAPFATSVPFTVKNNGATDLYLFLFKCRGTAIVPDDYTFSEKLDAASIAKYEERFFQLRSDWMQEVNTAAEEVDLLINRLAEAHQFPRVMLRGNPSKQLALRLFELADCNFTRDNVSGQFRIGYYKHRWIDEMGFQIETLLYLEPNLIDSLSGATAWLFPVTLPATF